MVSNVDQTDNKTSWVEFPEHVTVEGKIIVDGNARLSGDVHGDVKVTGSVEVMRSARIHGSISADIALISGRVDGEVSGETRVELKSTGRVFSVAGPHIMIDPEAHVSQRTPSAIASAGSGGTSMQALRRVGARRRGRGGNTAKRTWVMPSLGRVAATARAVSA